MIRTQEEFSDSSSDPTEGKNRTPAPQPSLILQLKKLYL